MSAAESKPEKNRQRLAAQTVIDAALALADTEGLEAVTIRRLATRLGVTPMAIYWHVRNKDELLDGIAARLLEDVRLPDEAGPGWQDQARAVLGRLLAVLRDHPAAAPLIATRTISTEHGLRLTEELLDILRRGGFSPAEATQAGRHALSTLANLVSSEPGPVTRNEPPAQQEAREQARAYLEALPPDRYPRLVEAARPLAEGIDPDTYFAFGLDLLMAGIEAMAARKTAP